MCGRYATSRNPEALVEEFEIEATEGDGVGGSPGAAEPDYNVAPTKAVPVVLQRRPRPVEADPSAAAAVDLADPPVAAQDEDGEPSADAAVAAAEVDPTRPLRWLRLLTWGLVPSWAKDRSIGSRMINARAETLLDSRGYRRAALARRCLVPADGWYEWQVSPVARDARGRPAKQPFYISSVTGSVLALAGVYELWRDPGRHPDEAGGWLASFAVVTTAAEPGLDAVHDRMPLVLPQDRWAAWLDPELRDEEAVRALLAPGVPGRFLARPVSTRVNSVANNGPELVRELPREQLHGVVDPDSGELIGADSPLF